MTDATNQFLRGGAEFTVDLLNKLKDTIITKENIIFSPFSIQACMALAYSGAKGETANEIARVMKYNSGTCQKVGDNFKNILDKYNGGPQLKMANKIYVQKGREIKQEYSNITKHKYYAEAETINFSDNQTAAETINSWVEQKTAGKICDLILAESLDSNTRLILLNALHFKGEWKEKFDKSRTKTSDFWISENECVKIEFMGQTTGLKFARIKDLECRALEMPYKDCDLRMLALLPYERNGLETLLEKLKSVNLLDLAKHLDKARDDNDDDVDDEEEDVIVLFPKFKIDYSMEMSNVLKEMGINTAFSPQADLSSMLESAEPLQISEVFHKTSIEVNEESSEAVAATYVKAQNYCMPPRFIADHPFIYWIWNRETILFAGTFVNAPKNN